MSNPVKPGWPDSSALPFMLFGSPAAAPAAQPLAQGLAGGMDLLKTFWGKLPGGTALPGFLVPTVDVEELDKRIGDLRAAESWIEVNLNMLRATIQGLEVQRNTISAIQSFASMAENPLGPKSPNAAKTGGLPAGWPTASLAPAPELKPDPVPPVLEAAVAEDASNPLGVAANNWLGFMQDQFSKVAQAAMATTAPDATAANKPAIRKAASKSPAKQVKRRRAATRKAAAPR